METVSLDRTPRPEPSVTGTQLATKLEALRGVFAAMDGVLVAFSGGVDSTLLAYIAHEVLSDRAVAVTAFSPAIPVTEVAAARGIAKRFGFRHRVVATFETQDEAYVRNTPNRCYVCKGIVFGRLLEVAREEGVPWLVYGANVDDERDYRPGARAAGELGARAPLAEVGLSKREIRALARSLGLPNADKPSEPCLSSRIPYGQPVTVEKLRRVADAERVLHDLGFDEVRVRHHGLVARIELPSHRLGELLSCPLRNLTVAGLKAAGFAYVSLDLEGFRSGSMNEPLSAGEQFAPPVARGSLSVNSNR